MKFINGIALATLIAIFLGVNNTSMALEKLELVTWGSVLPNMTIDANRASLSIQVDVGDDVPLETHITAHTPAGNVLQRTNLGYWVPWSGKLVDLVNNFSPMRGNKVNFKIFKDDDLSQELFPIKVMVAYRTASELKFGVFDLAGRRTP